MSAPPGSALVSRLGRVARLLAPVVVLALALVFIDFGEVWSLITSVDRPLLVLLLGLSTVDRVLMALRWSQLLRAADMRIPFLPTLSYYYQASVVSYVPPTIGSDIYRTWLVTSRHGLKTSAVLATVVMERVVATLSACFLGAMGLAVVVGSLRHDAAVYLSIGVVGISALSFAVFAASIYPPVYRFGYGVLRRFLPARLHAPLERMHAAYLVINQKGSLLALNLLTTVVEHVMQFTIMYYAGIALGITMSPLLFFAAIALVFFARRVVVYLDAWGVSEVISVLVLRAVSIEVDMALSISLLVHAVLLTSILPGLVLIARSGGGIRPGQRKLAAEFQHAGSPLPAGKRD